MPLIPTVLDLIYPRSCASCGGFLNQAECHICWDCMASLNKITHPFCAVCGDPVDGVVEHAYVCAWCSEQKPHFDMARSAIRYRGIVHNLIQSFKYGKAIHLTNDMVSFLAACVRTNYPETKADAVTFVPLYPRRERERTYNQAAILARGLAAALELSFIPQCLSRIRPTATQTDLSMSERRKNVRGAFEARNAEWIKGRSLLLVDDVMTTGATVDECARMLKKAGAARVFVATVARA